MEQKQLENMKKYFLWFPFSGTILFSLGAFYGLLFNKELVHLNFLIRLLVPFICAVILCLPFNFIFKQFPPYLKGKAVWITGFLFGVPVILYLV